MRELEAGYGIQVFTRANRQVKLRVAGRGHPWADRIGLRIGDLNGKDMVLREIGSNTRRAFEAAAAEAEVSPSVVLVLASGEAIREAVAAGRWRRTDTPVAGYELRYGTDHTPAPSKKSPATLVMACLIQC